MMLFLVWTLNCVYQDPKNSYEMIAEQFYLYNRSTFIKSKQELVKELVKESQVHTNT